MDAPVAELVVLLVRLDPTGGGIAATALMATVAAMIGPIRIVILYWLRDRPGDRKGVEGAIRAFGVTVTERGQTLAPPHRLDRR